MKCFQPFLFLAITAKILLADVSTTTEAVNPFNEFMQPNGGVNLFSGDVAFPLEILNLPGRNNMDISITLRYSSNIYNQVRGKNDISPTSWVGLGWAFGFGSITCDHKNTMTLTDDEYYWVSADGVRKEIIENYIEDNPYWKVEKITENSSKYSNSRIKGWILTDPSGKRFKYGNPDGTDANSDTRYATRYTYCWTNSKYVGEGSGGSPDLYPFQWDLCQIVDIYGNVNTFEYDTTAEALKCAFSSSDPSQTKLYTKASYLKKITNPQGDYILLETEIKGDPDEPDEDKKCNEYYDPHTLKDEPDGFLEFYETKRLKKIKVYQSNTLIKQASLCYEQISPIDDNEKSYLKSLLHSITVSNGGGEISDKTVFHYNTDLDNISNENYHFGALDSAILPRCGTVKINYKRQKLNLNTTFTEASISSISKVSGGTLKNDKEFIATVNSNVLSFYIWDGSEWKKDEIKIDPTFWQQGWGQSETYSEIFSGSDFLIIKAYKTVTSSVIHSQYHTRFISLFITLRKINLNSCLCNLGLTMNYLPGIMCWSKGYIVDIGDADLKVYRMNQDREWQITDINVPNGNVGVYAANDFFVITNRDVTNPELPFQDFIVYRWNGEEWKRFPESNDDWYQLNRLAGQDVYRGGENTL